ncbi:MAG TPA: M3 family oligoendopeptidase [Acholeplasmataceae bacterium]|nr:M3 family oligoendopeptidase [Acholeplasmataceae bacterium]
MKFSDYKYERPNIGQLKEKFEIAIEKINSAEKFEEIKEEYKEINKVRMTFSTMASLAYIRHSVNTLDEFYDKEREFFDENGPVYGEFEYNLSLALVKSKFNQELRNHYGDLLFDQIELSLKTFKPELIGLFQKENKLASEYDKLIASAKIEFKDKIHNLSQMGPYLQNLDRNIRKDAETASMSFFEENESKFDEIYDELVKIRTEIAHKLGYKNFVQLGYDRMGRTDYDSLDVANYRKQVREDLVPIAVRLYEEKGKRLGIKELKSYDLSLNFKSGNPMPKGDKDYLVGEALKMYQEMSPESGEYFKFMVDRELLDLETKPGKSGGGYCTYLPDYQSPFIFSNFNGTSGDVDVLTHEAGHGFQAYSSRHMEVPEYFNPTMESAEIHSMSMEFFAWPWMEKFFDNADKYRYSHLVGTITFIPYGVCVDEFQHGIYENPEMTKDERKALWKKLENIYTPFKKYDNEFLNKGTYWFRQGHIFSVPFYYIDYTLAQICAHQYWIKNQKDHEDAWNSYYKLCTLGGSKSFTNLLKEAKLDNPFNDGSIKKVTKEINKWLDEFDHTKLI